MDYLKSFKIDLPPFIERSYNISPGVVSAVFKVIWSIFSFIVVALLAHFGFAALGLDKSETESRQKSLWQLHNEYSQVQSVSNGRWGSMFSNLSSKRVVLGFLFWIFIYSFELLFSLSIDNAFVVDYYGTNCVGRVDNFTQFNTTMWNLDTPSNSGNFPPKNSTQLRQLLNTRQVGNIAMLGDGIFVISPINSFYKEDQKIKVARTGFSCSNTIHLESGGSNMPFLETPEIPRTVYVSTPHFSNFSLYDITLNPGYVNIFAFDSQYGMVKSSGSENMFLMLLANPQKHSFSTNGDPTTIYLSECTLFYEYGVVTIAQNGYLNETNIGESYTKSDDGTAEADFNTSNIYSHLIGNTNLFSNLDMPDVFLNADYNTSYPETMKVINDILTAHLLSGLDPLGDICSFNQEEVPVYFYVIGTKMSFGYILVGVLFALVTLCILFALSRVMFTQEERKRWVLYSKDWRFESFISTGDSMEKNEFKIHAMNTYPKNNRSNRTSEDDEETGFDPKSLLKRHDI